MLKDHTIVIDLGKTLSKISLWNQEGRLVDRQARRNSVLECRGIKRLDAQGTAQFVAESLSRYVGYAIGTIIPVGHGVTACLLTDDDLAFDPFDFEQPVPPDVQSRYRRERDGSSATEAPELPDALNLGAQLYWMETVYPEIMHRATILPWAQYWAWFLTGRAVSEVTSIGFHSDLWSPDAADFSPLARRLGWAEKFAPLTFAGNVVGTLRPAIAMLTGLSPDVRVLAGLHGMGARLHAACGFGELADTEATVLSTGRWFTAMCLPTSSTAMPALPTARDCHFKVDVEARPVLSARSMCGREVERLVETDMHRVDIKADQDALLAAATAVARQQCMVLPTLADGRGPFPRGIFAWVNRPQDACEQRAAACLYAALVTDASLDLVGASEHLLVEGRFAKAQVFVRALAALRPQTAVYTAHGYDSVAFGALRLLDPALKPRENLVLVLPLECDLDAYRRQWLAGIEASSRRVID